MFKNELLLKNINRKLICEYFRIITLDEEVLNANILEKHEETDESCKGYDKRFHVNLLVFQRSNIYSKPIPLCTKNRIIQNGCCENTLLISFIVVNDDV